MKLLEQAKDIPNNSVVTKRNGEKEYVLCRELILYRQGGGKQSIKAENDTVFLIPRNSEGSDNWAVGSASGDTLFLWDIKEEDLLTILQKREDERHFH